MTEQDDGISLRNRSTIYEYYVESFPDSNIGQAFRQSGLDSIRDGGGFRTALYEGDIQTALFRADRDNSIRLSMLLRDRLGYPVEITYDLDETRLETEDGEREEHWGTIMETLRENGAYPE